MLEELRISRFKTIRDLKLSFGRINLFIGGNGTGKSNILEAIGLSSACLGRGLADSDIGSKGLRITPPELMKSSFKGEDLPRTLELNALFSGQISYKAVLQSRENDPLLRFFSEAAEFGGKKVFGRSNRGARASGVSHSDRLDPSRGIWDQIKATYDVDKLVESTFQEFSKFLIYSPQTDFLRGRNNGRVDSPPIGLHGEGLPQAVASYLPVWAKHRSEYGKSPEGKHDEWDILKSCTDLVWLPGWASMFGVHKANSNLVSRDLFDRGNETVYFEDRFMHKARNRLSVYDSSEGTLFLLFAAIILTHPDSPRIFALDNVDNSLNPMLTRKLVEQIVKVVTSPACDTRQLGAKQVFLTSHNPTSIDAIDIFDDQQRVFVVNRNEKGHTKINRLKPREGQTREDWQLTMNGRNLSQVWLDGLIPGALGVD